MTDKTRPDYYQFPGGIEPIDLCKHLGFCEGNIVKYVSRAGRKEGEGRLADLKKALTYLNLIITDEKAMIASKMIENISDPHAIRHWSKH